MTPTEIELLHQASEANVLKNSLDPYLKSIEEKMIQDLKVQFRKGDTDGLQLNIQVGLLCAIEDLKNLLVRQMTKGQNLKHKQEVEAELSASSGEFDPYD